MDNHVVLIHFLPLEQYPPVMNLIDFVGRERDREMTVLTTTHRDKKVEPYYVNNKRISIKRLGKLDGKSSPIIRYCQYLKIYFRCIKALITQRPNKIFYYETLSSFPVYLYWKYINRDVKIYVHYHEYTSPGDYQTGMLLSRYFHRKEKSMYSSIEWLSHTNPERLRLFMMDEGLPASDKFFVMPNYPGMSWFREKKTGRKSDSIAIVYAGAVSRDTMYFEDFVNWVITQNGKVSFDIYSNNISRDDQDWLLSFGDLNIRLHSGVAYAELPDLLADFDVGVILYKGHIPNYVHNAPNKLFEYLACGLDVWVPSVMTGCLPYYTDQTFPKVIPVDFTRMQYFSWEVAIDRTSMRSRPSDYCFESVYPSIVSKLYSGIK